MIMAINAISHIQQLMTMGGYANYVWPAYGVVVIALMVKLCWGRRQLKLVKRQLQVSV